MGQVLLAMFGPTVVFGLFALLAMRFGAESRPYFDERPVLDDRPNWFPIAGSGGDDEDDDDEDPPDDGVPEAAAAGTLSGPRLVSIGPATSAALRELGFAPDLEAADHTPDGLVAALLADASGTAG